MNESGAGRMLFHFPKTFAQIAGVEKEIDWECPRTSQKTFTLLSQLKSSPPTGSQ